MRIHSPSELDRLGDEIAELSAHLDAATARLLCQDEDGMVVLRGRLEPEVGALLMQALTAARQALDQRAPVPDADIGHGGVSAGRPAMAQQQADALALLAALLRLAGEMPAPPPAAAAPRLGLHEIERLLGGSEPGPRDECLGKALLRAAGVRVVAERLVTSPDEAVAAADDLDYPVAVKVCTAAIPHKSEPALVRLGLADATAVARACADLRARLREAFPSVPVRGLLVQQMPPHGIEMVIGARRDPTFGPIVMAGLGGVVVEHLKDVAVGGLIVVDP